MAEPTSSASARKARPLYLVLSACVGLSVVLSEALCLIIYRVCGWGVDLATSSGWIMVLIPALIPATVSPIVLVPLIRSRRRSIMLLEELRRTTAELDTEVRQRRSAQEQLEFNAAHDELTGLRNRRGFFEATDEFVTGLCVVIDIDSFKFVNDQYGHAAGDRALIAITEVTLASIDERAIVGRLGGDELVVFDSQPDETIVRRLTRALREVPVIMPDYQFTLAASVGAAFIDEPTAIDEALALADAEMYREKARRHNTASHTPAGQTADSPTA